MRILLLLLEGTVWRRARSLSYCTGLGYEEGLAAHHVEFQTITEPWYPQAPQICGKRRFDQVWLDIGRTENLTDAWLEWMATRAPVRVGFIQESLDCSAEEQHIWPGLRLRRATVEHRLAFVTHVVACDECDVASLAAGGYRTFWWPQAVPARLICSSPPPPSRREAVFGGNLYGHRMQWLDAPGLVYVSDIDRGSPWPWVFNAIHLPLRGPLRGRLPGNESLLRAYLRWLRSARRHTFESWLRALQSGCAVVNLPHLVKSYPGRVVEGMAAGRPIISWDIPNRPRNRALFEPDREILLFDSPAQLSAQIERIQKDAELSRQMVSATQAKLRAHHTMEHRVAQLLRWLDTGDLPALN